MSTCRSITRPGGRGPRALGAGLLLAAVLAGCAGPRGPAPAAVASPAPAPAYQAVAAASGIEVTSVHLSATGRVVDFRYRVLDAASAKQVLSRRVEPYALDQATGVHLPVPRAAKIGALRQSALEPTVGRIYFILFGNTGRAVKKGSLITVVIGDLRLEGVPVD